MAGITKACKIRVCPFAEKWKYMGTDIHANWLSN